MEKEVSINAINEILVTYCVSQHPIIKTLGTYKEKVLSYSNSIVTS